MHLLGLKDKDKIVAAALILSKITPIKKKMFYSPRGFLIDYNNYELLKEFTKKIKEYVKKDNGIFIKIDPYLMNKQREINRYIVPTTENNFKAFENLKKLGYKHFGFNLMLEALQPRWIYVINTKNKTIDELLKDMDRKTRQIIKTNEKYNIECREIGFDEISKFKDITKHTGDRREFIDRPLSYYENMYNCFHDSGILKIFFTELNADGTIVELRKEKEELEKDYDNRKNMHDNNIVHTNEKKYEQKQTEIMHNIERLDNKIKEIEQLKEKHGNIIVLSGILFLIYGNEVVALVGGSYKEVMNFQSFYYLNYKMLEYAVLNGYNRYNFYGITGDFSESNPLYGLYSFKKDFGGEVVELIGEFDLIISKPDYYMYKVAFACYHKLKNVKNKIRLINKR